MIPVVYSHPQFRTKKEDGVVFIFCVVRRRWLVLTDEEWVRQNFVQHLITEGYPAELIAVEKELLLNGLKKRFDILVYDANTRPWLMVECKKASVELSETVLQQVLRYNIVLPVPYLIITNGNHTLGWQKKENGLSPLSALPQWKAITPFL